MSARLTILAVVTVAGVLAGGCRRGARPVSRTWPVMGTFCSVSVPAADADALHRVATTARATVSNLNALLTVYSADSEISQINDAAGRHAVPVDPLTRRSLELCLHYAELTGGAFDPTVGAVVRLWGFNTGRPPEHPPTADAIRDVLAGVGYRRLKLTADGAFLDDARADLDLGGIAKGLAVDTCYEAITAEGRRDLMVNLGGNIRCGGQACPGRTWSVGVRNPFDRGEILGALSLTGGDAVATSGNYERFVTIGGRRYAHIIDPRTGRPVEGMAGVTVISTNAVEADALSTALYVMGLDEATTLLARLPGCEALLVPDDEPLTLHVTRGFRERFDPVNDMAQRLVALKLRGDNASARFEEENAKNGPGGNVSAAEGG